MNGVLAFLTAIAGFILGVRVGFTLARRNDAKRAPKARPRTKPSA